MLLCLFFQLNEHCLSALNEEISNVLKTADDPSIKEVKGIEERLGLLNKQIEDAKKLEKDQRDLATVSPSSSPSP